MANSRVTLIILAHLHAGPLLACKELCENEDKAPQLGPAFTWLSSSLTVGRSQKLPVGLIGLVTRTSLVAQMVKCLPAMRETRVQSLGWGDLLEKEMATHSSILAWKIPWMEEPGRLQSMGSQRVG